MSLPAEPESTEGSSERGGQNPSPRKREVNLNKKKI